MGSQDKRDSGLVQGTLDLLILRTLSLEPLHGYGIGLRLEQLSRGALRVNAGSLFPAFRRLERDGQVVGTWQRTENGRRAKYYSSHVKAARRWHGQRRSGNSRRWRSHGCSRLLWRPVRRLLRRALRGLGAISRREQIDDELEEELDAFLDAAADHHQREGRSPEDARRAARLALGSRAAVKDHVRDIRWESALEDMWRDVVYGCRYLKQHRGFAAAAVLTLGLGIGIATAVFSVVNTVLVQPLPYEEANRLVRVVERAAPPTAGAPLLRRISMQWSEMAEWRTHSTTLPELAFTLTPPITLMRSSEGAVRLSGALVSTNLFTMLGAEAELGRTLDVRDEVPGAGVVVLSASTWRRYFGGRPDIVGQTVALKTLGPESGFLDGTPLTIVGVMPPTFDYPAPYVDYWAPITADSPVRRWPGSGLVIGRLAAGVSVDARRRRGERHRRGTAAHVQRLGRSLVHCPEGARRFDVEGIKEQTVASARPALRALSIAVFPAPDRVRQCRRPVLARGFSRQREVAVRVALGAGRGRVIRQLLTESGILAVAGGALGVLLAVGAPSTRFARWPHRMHKGRF